MGGRQGRRWLARAAGLALALQLLLTPVAAQALTWRLPGREPSASASARTQRPQQRLREVAPPAWVQGVQAALEERDPQVRILAPADGALLPDGPWTLRLRVSDWPLVDAGPLGLGPHLVVQIDQDPPRPVLDTELEMPPLSPGSHRLTVYAATPWGEAHKSPAALQQIRVHRLAANPATLPAPGTPQLVPVSPSRSAGAPPLLLDWLLIDAPLQGLRTEGSGWRLRVTLNGESVLLDRQVPIWLQGWQPGSNALLLELLDGRGELLNPPFNSVLREVVAAAGAAERQGPLSPLELAVLLGERPPSDLMPAPAPEPPATAAAPAEPEPEPEPKPEPAEVAVPEEGSVPLSEPASVAVSTGEPAPAPEELETELGTEPEPEPKPKPAAVAVPERASTPLPEPEPAPVALTAGEPAPAPTPEEPEPEPEKDTEPAPKLQAAAKPEPAAEASAGQAVGPVAPPPGSSEGDLSAEAPPERAATAEGDSAQPAPAQAATSAPDPPAAAASRPAQPARAEVNPDGTLKRPPRPSPLERLRERLGR